METRDSIGGGFVENRGAHGSNKGGSPLSTDSDLKTIDLVVKDPLREQSWGLDPD